MIQAEQILPTTPVPPVTTPAPTLQDQETIQAEQEQQVKKRMTRLQIEGAVAKLVYYWNRILTVLLTAYGVKGVYDAIVFVVVTYPELNTKLDLKLVTSQEVNQLSVMAAMIAITTVIYFLLALRLHNVRRETGPTLDLIISMAFLIFTPILQNYVSMIDFVSLVETLF